MRVKIDCREKDLIPICKNLNEEIDYKINIETGNGDDLHRLLLV